MSDAREWLETDGLGGFAMGCADGIRTRRYHAYLLSAARPPDQRMVLVADLEVFVETAAGRFALSAHRYRGDVVYPDGASHLHAFAWRPHPRWEWALPDGTRVAGELVVLRGAPRTYLRWTRLAGRGAARLWLRPLLAGRDYHATHHENGAFRFDAEVDPASQAEPGSLHSGGERVTWRPYPGVPAIVALANARYDHAPDWYRAFELAAEAERGLDCLEDLAAPGSFTFDLAAGPAALVLSADGGPEGAAAAAVERAFAREADRRASLRSHELAAEAYVAARGDGQTIIAGFPWFCDWGRDTFISLRGLLLATGRREIARRILRQWAGQVSRGMLPNRYDEHASAPEFNSVDAALWFVIAAEAYLAGGAEPEDRRALEGAIDAIVAGYAAGTRHRIGVDPADGLLAAGEPGLQLTWMDAKLGDEVITPRIGKPVEVNALWLNALAIAGRRDARWRTAFERGRAAFRARFWDPERRQLYDVVDCDHVPGTADATCRPNQLLAIGGLPLQLIDGEAARAVVDTAFAALWTPAGPRSLAVADPRYCGRYGGGPAERDRVYHNGPVWPWLAGPAIEAWVRVRGGTPEARREAWTRLFLPLAQRLELAGLGHLSEICEGDPPHRAVGCPFQAWSVAELIRLKLDVLGEPDRFSG